MIQAKILSFYGRLQQDPHHRFRSWEHCYGYFQSNEINEEEVDTACLHLGFYLASWGMYRGSSFLLQKDCFVHRRAVEEILNPKYKVLRNASFKQFFDDASVALLFELINKIKVSYEGIGDSEKKKARVTDTLVTKILLGTLGCVPAYDRFFIAGLKSQNLPYSYLNPTNFKEMIDFCSRHSEEFEVAQKIISTSREYPFMKLVDMYFWRLGEKG